MGKTLVRRWLAALLTLALVSSLAPAAFAADSVTLDKSTASVAVGNSITLTATPSVSTDTVTWSYSDSGMAADDRYVTVTGTGNTITIEGKNAGQVSITATYNNTSATCVVTVTPAEVTDIEVKLYQDKNCTTELGKDSNNKYTISANVKESKFLYVKITPTWSDGKSDNRTLSVQRLSWSVSGGGSVVSVSPSAGTGPVAAIPFTATREGETELSIKIDYQNQRTDGAAGSFVNGTAVCKVVVGGTTEVVIQEYGVSKREVNMTVNTPKVLTAYVAINDKKQEEAVNKQIVWSTKGSSILRLDSTTGSSITVTPLKEGTATLTATYDGVSRDVICIVKAAGSGGDTDPDNPDPPTTDDVLPPDVEKVLISINGLTSPHTMDPGSESFDVAVRFIKTKGEEVNGLIQRSQNGDLFAVYQSGSTTCELPIHWNITEKEDNKNVISLSTRGTQLVLTANHSGEASFALTLSDKNGVKATSSSVEVEVNGFYLKGEKFTVEENGSLDLKEDGIIGVYGDAKVEELSCWSDASNIAAYVNYKIAAYSPGTTTFSVSDTQRGFRGSFEVEVKPDPNSTINYGTLYTQTQKVLNFSDLLSAFRRQAGGSLSHITGLNVDAGKGTLYYKYNETTSTGTGVGAGSYYHPYRKGGIPTGQASLEDLAFVPKPGFAGEVTIYYTGVSEGDDNGESQNYACKLVINVDPGSGSNAGISLNTDYNTPVRLSGDDFSRVCRERLGTKLNYVVFSQPPERQGKLYTNYSAAGNYGSVVDTARRYTLKELDDIWFVPAPGYSGPVTVYYTAYGTGNSGSYSGQVSITVGREGGVSIGGLAYDVAKGGVAHFDDEDFNDYCREILYEQNRYDQQTLSFIRFDSLPSASEGVLYYDYRSSVNTGTRAVAGTSYYYGTRTPRIDRLSFVPAADFTGTIKIPFTGWTADGTSFGGNVEINVRSGTGAGDIYYTCAPGRTVSFRSSDFTSLSNQLTGRTVDYIVLERLPNSADGFLYYGTSRITSTGTQYRNSSIGRLSFRASSTFSGPVDIPFEGRSAGGVTFHGIVTIGTSSSGGGGSSRSSIRYNADSGSTAVFSRVDFDDLSRWETDRDVSSVRFTPPLSSEGSLYRNYRSSSSMGTRITSTTTVNASDLDRVAFVPASGFNGTAYIDFTATASGSGGSFTGSVEVMVGRDYGSGSRYFSDMAGYSATQQAAVDFLYERNITRGLTTGQYGPENSIRRGDFARMIYQAFAFAPSGVSQAFADVPAGVYYAEAVNALYSRGVVSGIGGGYYAPDSTLTRQDAICMVQRAMRVTGRPAGDGSPSVLYSYSDGGSVAGYAQGAMAFAVQQGYLPLNGGWLDPTRALTRVDMAEILYRVLTS